MTCPSTKTLHLEGETPVTFALRELPPLFFIPFKSHPPPPHPRGLGKGMGAGPNPNPFVFSSSWKVS